jgi:hypothetical protein
VRLVPGDDLFLPLEQRAPEAAHFGECGIIEIVAASGDERKSQFLVLVVVERTDKFLRHLGHAARTAPDLFGDPVTRTVGDLQTCECEADPLRSRAPRDNSPRDKRTVADAR